MKIPIQSLFNIFSNEECHFTLHDRLYELIMSHHQITNNSNIFILLQFIDGNSISSQNLTEMIANKDKYFGFMPKINMSNLSLSNNNSNEEEISLPIYTCVNDLNYKLNHSKFTAEAEYSLPSGRPNLNFHIPRSIRFNSKDYLVTDFIFTCCFNHSSQGFENIESLSFSEDSIIQKVDLSRFCFNYINNLSIPPSVNEFDCGAFIIKNINISPNNHNMHYDGTFVYGKSNQRIDEYDTLVYSHKNIEKVSILPSIKLIKSFCFYYSKLNEVDFSQNSNLSCIDKYAFSRCSSLESISIGQNVISIEMGAFKGCEKLKTIKFSQFSKLSFIGYCAFENTLIESITIPKKVVKIDDCAFYNCKELKTVDFENDSILFSFGKNVFLGTKIERIEFPRSLRILKGQFYVKEIDILTTPDNNGLQWIDNVLYGKSDLVIDSYDTIIYAKKSIENVLIPSNIKYIEQYCFSKCTNLKSITFSPYSDLRFLGSYAFYQSAIESIIIPSHVTSIEEGVFKECKNLCHVEFSPNSDLHIIKKYAFQSSPIGSIIIPRHVKTIEMYAFCQCNLTTFDFENTSEIPKIDYYALQYNGKLKEFSVPKGSNIIPGIFGIFDQFPLKINYI